MSLKSYLLRAIIFLVLAILSFCAQLAFIPYGLPLAVSFLGISLTYFLGLIIKRPISLGIVLSWFLLAPLVFFYLYGSRIF